MSTIWNRKKKNNLPDHLPEILGFQTEATNKILKILKPRN